MRALVRRRRLRPWLVASALLPALAASRAGAELHEGFETHEPTWRDAGGDARYKIERQLRIAQDAHSGNGCEFVETQSSDGGTAIYLSYNLGNAPVIDELTASLWVKADQPGIQFAARVVFPRTLEPSSQRPVTAVILGTSSTKPGQWERLTITNIRNQVEQQARVLRAQLRLPVDTRQSYVDRLLLNVYVGAGKHQVWIDDLEVTGIVYAPTEPQPNTATNAPSPLPQMDGFLPISRTTESADAAPVAGAVSVVELKGQTVLVRGKQFFPRIIEHQGEPLPFLQQLGFNTVRMRTTPARETLGRSREARAVDHLPAAATGRPRQPVRRLDADFGAGIRRSVSIGAGLGSRRRTFGGGSRRAETLGRACAPTRSCRGRVRFLCQAAADLRSLSRQVDVVVTKRLPMGTTFELADYGDWLRDRTRLARPGTPQWAVDPNAGLARTRAASAIAFVAEAGGSAKSKANKFG